MFLEKIYGLRLLFFYLLFTIISEEVFGRFFWGSDFQFCYAVVLQEYIRRGTLFQPPFDGWFQRQVASLITLIYSNITITIIITFIIIIAILIVIITMRLFIYLLTYRGMFRAQSNIRMENLRKLLAAMAIGYFHKAFVWTA